MDRFSRRRPGAAGPLFEIDLELPAKGSRKSSQTLYSQLKDAIADGRLAAGTRMPSTRKAEAFFRVSRNTAVEVYERLLNEGYVVTRNGSGTYVADRLTVRTPSSGLAPAAPADIRLNGFWLRPEITAAMGFWRQGPEVAAKGKGASSSGIDFRPALVDSRLFPFDTFRRVSAKQLRGLEKKPPTYKSPQGNQGNYSLRAGITQHIALTRAVACQPDDILVTSGAQQAFDLLARVLVTPGETIVALEDPGYPPLRVAFAAAGAKLVPAEVDDEGLVVEKLPRGVRVICVCPSHQFPLGVAMSARRRQSLIEFARDNGAVVIEDDYDGEFRFDGNPLRALRTRDAADVVFYVGTFSKCMLPALRLGFLVAPPWALQTLIAAKNCLDWHCPTPLQLGVAGFIAEGHLARHVRKMREIYKQRRDLLLKLLESKLDEWVLTIPSFYGMHVAVTMRDGGPDADALAEKLLERNVRIHSLGRYYLGPQTRNGLVFGYGAVGVAEITRGVSAVYAAFLEG